MFHPATEQLKMGSLYGEQVETVVMTPPSEDPQISRVAGPGSTALPGEERGNSHPLRDMERIVINDDLVRRSVAVVGVGHDGLLGDPASRGDGINAPTNTMRNPKPSSPTTRRYRVPLEGPECGGSRRSKVEILSV